jgi:HK97 family phage portal protein
MARGLGRFVPARRVVEAAAKPGVQTRSLEVLLAEFQRSGGSPFSSEGYAVAWSVPSAWRASTLLAGLIGGLPLDAYESGPRRVPVLLDPQPMLFGSFTNYRTNSDVISAWVLDYLMHGNAIGLVVARDPATQEPTSIVPVPADWVTVTAVDKWTNFDLETLAGNLRYNIGGEIYGPHEVMHVRGPSRPGAMRGTGVLEAALSSFTLANEQRAQASSVSKHGVPTGVLYSDDPDATPDELAAGKADFMRGQQDGRTIAALPPGIKFMPLAWNPEELQLVEARKMSDNDMALLFGLPASFLNVEGSSLTYSNIGQDSLNLLKFTVNLILTRFEEEITRLMAPGRFARFDRDAVLEMDMLSRYQAYATADWMTVDEKREREGLAPLPPAPAPVPVVAPEEGMPSE